MAEIVQFNAKARRDIADTVKQVLRERPGDKRGSRRYPRVNGGHKLFPFTLTEDIGNTTSGEASATILEWDFSTTKHSGETVLDNGGIFADGTSGSKGIAVKIGSDYHIIQLACGGE